MKRRMKTGVITLLCLILCILSGSRIGAEGTGQVLKVLVPLWEDNGFVACWDGVFSGYYIDCLDEIARYTGWNYEFAAVESEQEFRKACEDGGFDLMTGIVYTKEYDRYFEYPQNTVGASRCVFAVPRDSELILDPEYSYLRGVRIGVYDDPGMNGLKERFESFCRVYGITCVSEPEDYDKWSVNFIPVTTESWKEKLESGEIDGILTSDFFCLSQKLHAAASFGMDQLYFVSPQGQRKQLEHMNNALERIRGFDPEFYEKLYQKYFSSNSKHEVPFNQTEEDYLTQEHTFQVSLMKDFAPYSYVNNAGQTAGTIPEVLQMVTERTQGRVRFEYVFYDTMQEASAAIMDRECQINGISIYSRLLGRDSSLRRSSSYYTDSLLFYRNNRNPAGSDTETETMPELSEEMFDKTGLGLDSTGQLPAQERLSRVDNGTDSGTVMLGHVGDYYQSYYGHRNLDSYPVGDGEMMFCFEYGPEMDQTAVDMIDKCLLGVSEQELDSYITEVSLFEHKSHTMKDYIKEHLAFFAALLASILFVICTLLIVIVIILMQNSRKVYRLLYQDEITGGISYKKFLEKARRLCREPGNNMILYLNISSFKYINDVFGYDQGNEVLCKMKKFLNESVQGALLARVYADRFVALIHYDHLEEVRRIMRIRLDEFEEVCRNEFPDFNIWVKVGAYTLKPGDELQKAVNLANYAVDEIQKISKNEFIFYDEAMHERVLIQKEIEKDMRGAIKHGEFEPFYQPKYNIETKELIGAEALVRWRHPEKGLLSPAQFIPVFEKNHFIIQVDYYIFECVCRFLKKLMEEGVKLFPISSNFSRLHLGHPDFVEKLIRIVDRHQVPAKYLEIEITETVATEDFDRFITAVRELKEKGFQVSIDDFGSGYSSIQLLYKLPIDVLKLDKAFVDHKDVSEFELELVDSIISVSHKNGIQIICEGVETIEQEEYVRKHNCIYVQGFLYSKPVPEQEFWELLD